MGNVRYQFRDGPSLMTANENRRRVMLLAWDLYRDGGRTFADALRGSWKFIKGLPKAAAAFLSRARQSGGHLRLSPSLIQSPMQRVISTQRYPRQADQFAARLTSRLGA